jgi:hypothetical protein
MGLFSFIMGCTEITMSFLYMGLYGLMLLNGSFSFYCGLYRNYNGFSVKWVFFLLLWAVQKL